MKVSGTEKRWLLLPFAFLYGLGVSIRNRLFDYSFLKSQEFDIPIISVGNITVGGTGKTPHVEYLVSLLKDNFQVATLSRGYKRKSKGFQLAGDTPSVNQVGDEPKQIKLRFPDIEVAVDNKRVNGIKKLLENEKTKDLDVIILDDAYQHRYVKPGINILLIDYNRPLSEDFLLPVGTLRERPHRKDRANIIIMAKSPREMKPIEQRLILKRLMLFPYQTLYFSTFKYGDLIPVFKEFQTSQNFRLNNSTQIILVTGIAYPEPLINYLENIAGKIRHLRFGDHHDYSASDIHSIEAVVAETSGTDKIVLTTEKDAARLQENKYIADDLKGMFYYIPVEIEFIKDEENRFDKQIIDYVRKNKRKLSIHKK